MSRLVLLDECLPHDLRHDLIGHVVETAAFAGVAGLSNGRLIAAIEGRFDVLVTVDSALIHQQSLVGRRLAVVLMKAPSNRLEALQPLIPAVLAVLGTIRAGEVVTV